MPTVQLPPDSHVTLEPAPVPTHASARQQRSAPHGTHIYFAVAALALVLLVRSAVRRFSHHLPSWATGPWQLERGQPVSPKDFKAYSRAPSAPAPTIISAEQAFYRAGFDRDGQPVWAAGLLGFPAGQGPTGLAASVLGMEEQRDRTGSRGVSTSAAGSRHAVSSSRADLGSRKASSSPRLHKSRSSSRRHSNSSDGSATAEAKGERLMLGDSWGGDLVEDTVVGHRLDETARAMFWGHSESGDYHHSPSATTPRFSRPPPPPPLTPPTMLADMFTFEDRQPSYAVSIPPQLDASFIHQPNPDYTTASTSTVYRLDPSPRSATGTPQRRSYTKSVPIGIPVTSGSSTSSSHQSQDMAWGESSTGTFSPASYPPSSPHLPPPPPGSYDQVIYDYDGQQHGEIDLQGSIISVTDDAGHGWTRHTRVYGGGVCLACAAAGGRQGGFYGDNVPLSERR